MSHHSPFLSKQLIYRSKAQATIKVLMLLGSSALDFSLASPTVHYNGFPYGFSESQLFQARKDALV